MNGRNELPNCDEFEMNINEKFGPRENDKWNGLSFSAI